MLDTDLDDQVHTKILQCDGILLNATSTIK